MGFNNAKIKILYDKKMFFESTPLGKLTKYSITYSAINKLRLTQESLLQVHKFPKFQAAEKAKSTYLS